MTRGSLLTIVLVMLATFGAAMSPVSAQSAPTAACLPCATATERVDGIIAILIGHARQEQPAATEINRDGQTQLARPCAGVSVLAFYTWGGPAVSYATYLDGASIADQVGDETAAVAALTESYRAALDRVLAEGLLNERQANWLAIRAYPHFVWLATYRTGVWDDTDIVHVIQGDALSAPVVSECLSGTPSQQVDGIIAVLIGMAIDTGAWDETMSETAGCRAAVATVAHFASPLPDVLQMDAEQMWAEYQGGASLAAIAEKRGIAIEQLGLLLVDVWEHAYATAVETGEISAAGIAVDPSDPSGNTVLLSPCGVVCLLTYTKGESLRADDPFGVLAGDPS